MKAGGNFFLDNIEKIVIPLVGVVCLVLLVTRVFVSPNRIEYDGRKYGPGRIDKHVLKQAEELRANLEVPARARRDYSKKVTEFSANMSSAFRISSNLVQFMPYTT